jgi:UDP-N-acetylenolpyruvoylglucosamine reductase
LGYTESMLRFQFSDIEIGYRNSNGENKWHCLVKFNSIDLGLLPLRSKEVIERMCAINHKK